MVALQSPPESPLRALASSHNHPNAISHDNIPFSATFSNDLMRIVLHPPTTTTGIGIIPESASDTQLPHSSIRLTDIDLSCLSTIATEALPLPLEDPRRIYSSSIPGVNLTHPGGWLEGGTGPTPLLQTQNPPSADAEAYLVRHAIRTPEQLHEQIQRDIATPMEELREMMRKREEAVRANEEVEREVERLVEQRKLERKIEERMRKEMQARRRRRDEMETV